VPDHFRTVGFTLERDEIASLIGRAVDGGTVLASPRGEYRAWTPGAGAELWVMLRVSPEGGRELTGMAPHFDGGGRIDAMIEAVEPHPEFPMEGELYAWALDRAGAHARYPFSASVPDFAATAADLNLPARVTLALAGFAQELEWWPDDDAYRADRAARPTEVAEADLLPIGLFGTATGKARARAVVTGAVVASALRTNPATERRFRHLRLATFGGEIDVVADLDLVPGDPGIGAVARADCWLSARIAD